MNSLQLHGEDLYNDGVQNEPNHETFFDDQMEEDQGGGCGGSGGGGIKEIWMDQRNDHQEEDLIDVNDPIFYTNFPPLPDFPCMSSCSSSSSSSSTPAPIQANTPSSSSSVSSSAASWPVLKSEAEEDPERRHYLDHHGHYNFNNNINENKRGYYDDNCQNDRVHHLSTASLSSTASMEIPPPSDLHHQEHVIKGGDCMDVMESFGYMDLLENNDFFAPSSIFHPEEDTTLLEELNCQQIQEDNNPSDQPKQEEEEEDQVGFPPLSEESILQDMKIGGNSTASDDLAMVFLDWLRNNKETISAEDLRKVKIKKSTIECAANRLGGGKEAMKQLLKLILEWVQTNHLQKRRLLMTTSSLPSSTNCNDPTSTSTPLPNYQYQPDPSLLQNPNPSLVTSTQNLTLNCTSITQPDQSCLPWISPSQSFISADPVTLAPGFPPMGGYMGDPFGNGSTCSIGGMANYPLNPVDYQMLGSSQAQLAPTPGFSFPPKYASFGENNLHGGPLTQPPNSAPAYAGFGNQYPYPPPYLQGQGGVGGGDSGLVKLGFSATKEARKKRMARQRRFLSHHRNHHSSHQNHNNPNQSLEAHARLGNDNVIGTPSAGQGNPGNWMYWPPVAAAGANAAPPGVLGDVAPDRAAMQGQNFQRQVAFDKRQGWKPEKNLKFLLQKVLKQSDVGNLGRIVLPKKEAETHLPELEARDGISIAMEDIGTSRVWNMRYRFWPNNKSRMYLLENTGDFVRTNGLQEGDFIVIYSDIKCGKYMIRGVKVRQQQQQQPQQGQKLESKRAGKSQRNGHANSPGPVDHNGIGSSVAIN